MSPCSRTLLPLTDPLVFQIHGGCKLYTNGTRWSFANIGEGGRDLVTYDLNRERWLPRRSTPLAELMSNTLTDLRAVSGLLEHIFSTSLPNYILMLHKEGKADLERRGERSLALGEPPYCSQIELCSH